jgi:Zn-dependent protease with chaperone function
MTVPGKLFAPRASRSEPARLTRIGDRFAVAVEGLRTSDDVQIAAVSEAIAGVDRRVSFADGRVFQTGDHDALDRLLANSPWGRKSKVAWLERMTPLKALVMVGLLVVAVLGARAAIPVIADSAAKLVPSGLERKVGQVAFAQFDRTILNPSALPTAKRHQVEGLYRRVVAASGLGIAPTLHIRSAPAIGANAFAFPGGPVVITDQLVERLDKPDFLMGVMAHEIGHVERHHGIKGVLRTALVVIAISAAFGDSSTLLEEMAALSGGVVTGGYSRSFEREADHYALTTLSRLGIAQERYAAMLAGLDPSCAAKCKDTGWYSTHPSTADRIQAVRAWKP